MAEKNISGKPVSPTLNLLISKHPSVVDLIVAAKECSRAHQTFLNELSSGRCTLRCFKQGRRWYVRLVDLAGYIDSHFDPLQTNSSAKHTPRRGRPTKAQMIARRTAILNGMSGDTGPR